MPKLNLKRTPQEEADRRARKRQKREHHSSRASKRREPSEPHSATRKWASDEDSDDSPYAANKPGPSASGSGNDNLEREADHETLRAELEEARFREKMAAAFDDDDRLDSLEARMNDYAHVPGRWRTQKQSGVSYAEEDLFNLDPAQMDDEEYAEWIRTGMYRKTHAREYAEEQERRARHEARRDEQKAQRARTVILAALADEEHRRKKAEKEARRLEFARDDYNSRWTTLLSTGSDDVLTFADIPWPVLAAQRQNQNHSNDPPPAVSLDALTAADIAAFLVPGMAEDDPAKKARKDKLRETYLRFHPDKFEGRFMNRIRDEGEKKQIREAIGVVVRALNTLM
ncbi:hypothetical protein C8F01DRAFT_1206142 [Mycena amicta]|nr:hypothetical protein C8F01DRAFT_1206142 [Mycena amicta]